MAVYQVPPNPEPPKPPTAKVEDQATPDSPRWEAPVAPQRWGQPA